MSTNAIINYRSINFATVNPATTLKFVAILCLLFVAKADDTFEAGSGKIKFDDACTDVDIWPPGHPNYHHVFTNNIIKFPSDYDIYKKNSPYKCKWTFHTPPSIDNIKVRLSFTKFRIDQRCKNYPHMYDPQASNFSSCGLFPFYANKYSLSSVNRVIISELTQTTLATVEPDNIVSSNLSINDIPASNYNGVASEAEQIGCLCGMSDDDRYVELNDATKADFSTLPNQPGIDQNSYVHWYMNSQPNSSGLSMQIFVPHPFLGVGFTMKYEFIHNLQGCGGKIPLITDDKAGEMANGGFIVSPTLSPPSIDPNEIQSTYLPSSQGATSTVPAGPIFCIWNITLPNDRAFLERYGGLPPIPNAANHTNTQNSNETLLSYPYVQNNTKDWRLLLNFTDFELPESRLADGMSEYFSQNPPTPSTAHSIDRAASLYITNPGSKSPISALPLLINAAANRIKALNSRNNGNSKTSPDSLLMLESAGNSLIIKLIIKSWNQLPTFKIRWTPFLHLEGNETECQQESVSCIEEEDSNYSSNITSNVSSPGNQLVKFDTSALITTAKKTNNNVEDEIHRHAFCIPQELLCNGYVECPNSQLDESRAFCANHRATAIKRLESYMSEAAPGGEIWPPFIATIGKNIMIDKDNNGKQDQDILNDSGQFNTNDIEETENNVRFSVGESKSLPIVPSEGNLNVSTDRRYIRKGMWALAFGIPLGILILLLPFIFFMARKCINDRRNRYDIATKYEDQDEFEKGQPLTKISQGRNKKYSVEKQHQSTLNGEKGVNGHCNGGVKPKTMLIVKGTNSQYMNGNKHVNKNANYNNNNNKPNHVYLMENESLLENHDGQLKNNSNKPKTPPFGGRCVFPPTPNSNAGRAETEEIERSETLPPEENVGLLSYH